MVGFQLQNIVPEFVNKHRKQFFQLYLNLFFFSVDADQQKYLSSLKIMQYKQNNWVTGINN